MQDDADGHNAFRINIPLSRVDTMEKTEMLSFAGLITLTFDPKSSNGASNGTSNGTSNGASNGAPTEQPTSSTEDLSLLDTPSDKQKLQFGVLREDPTWDNAMVYVNNAKTSASKGNADWPGSRVYVDMDPRTSESSEKSENNLSDLVKSVSFALGLDTTKEIWSTPCSFLSSPSSHLFFSS
jgi:hypothetical protein